MGEVLVLVLAAAATAATRSQMRVFQVSCSGIQKDKPLFIISTQNCLIYGRKIALTKEVDTKTNRVSEEETVSTAMVIHSSHVQTPIYQDLLRRAVIESNFHLISPGVVIDSVEKIKTYETEKNPKPFFSNDQTLLHPPSTLHTGTTGLSLKTIRVYIDICSLHHNLYCGPPETKLAMVAYLGELVLSNDVKAVVARMVGSSLVNIMRSGNMQSREAGLKALNQISSFDASAKVLIEAGILPPLVKEFFIVGANQLPTQLKEVYATILANLLL
ncbi:hypothetical protein IFM89_009994 [Coptis chinensis]|uniref:Uncharacterized protein n=1 Tax=Coptis chinensis TaxID=261450 RepID=A0A835GW16_9MAGN|nr:hypothetical protein IFM89_009994 [Coptis chinensis]